MAESAVASVRVAAPEAAPKEAGGEREADARDTADFDAAQILVGILRAPAAASTPPPLFPGIPIGHGQSAGGGQPSPRVRAGLMALQRTAGNRAVTALVRTVSRDGPGLESATIVQPPTEGVEIERMSTVDQDGSKTKDGRAGLNLRPAPSDTAGGNRVPRLDHNDHVLVKREMADNWVYVIVTDGQLQNSSGYVSRKYLNMRMPPEPAAPDPGATLYLPKVDGETAFQLVHDKFGAEAEKTAQDKRFFSNVLKYMNDAVGWGDRIETKTVLRYRNGFPTAIEEQWLKTGQQIWVPSLKFALSLKGKVSAGSWLRDTWEWVKGAAEKLAAIPAFIAGLIVGAVESIKDLFVGLFELVWDTIKSLGSNLVAAAEAVWDLFSSPEKRQAFLEGIDKTLNDMLGEHVGFLRRAYNWGRIVGYATMEVVSLILLAGAGTAIKAGRWGARLAKISEAIKATGAVKTIMTGATKIAKSPTGLKIANAASKTSAAVVKVATPVVKAAGKVTKLPGKLITLAGDLMDLPARAIRGAAGIVARGPARGRALLASRRLKRAARKYGWPADRLAAASKVIQDEKLRVWLRKSTPHAPARMAEGAIPKPVAIKANTLDELDLVLGDFTKDQLGLVAHFRPKDPSMWQKPRGMSERKWQKMQPRLEARFEKRRKSFEKIEPEMAALTRPTTTEGSHYFKVENGLVKQVDVGAGAAVESERFLTGDVDIFHITHADGSGLHPNEYASIDARFLETHLSEHGTHMWWPERNDLDIDAYYAIIDGHRNEGVIEIGPDLRFREIKADQVPGVDAVLESAGYKEWKQGKRHPGVKAHPPQAAKAPAAAPPAVELKSLFAGSPPKASQLEAWAQAQGWTRTQSPTGPIIYLDDKGIKRMSIKRGSPRAPGSAGPHVELRDAAGNRIDPAGNQVLRRSPGNHTPIEWDL